MEILLIIVIIIILTWRIVRLEISEIDLKGKLKEIEESVVYMQGKENVNGMKDPKAHDYVKGPTIEVCNLCGWQEHSHAKFPPCVGSNPNDFPKSLKVKHLGSKKKLKAKNK